MKKKLIIFLVLFLSTLSVTSQTPVPPPPPPPVEFRNNDIDDKIWTKVEQEAQFPGGNEGWRNFLVKNLKPDTIVDKIYIADSLKSITHTVILRFIVKTDGSLSDIAVEQSSNPYCSLEAIRVIKLSPKWIPGYQNKRAVNCYRRQPITFYFEQE